MSAARFVAVEGELVEAGRDDVPPSEASATLARLLGEVSRG